MSAVQVRDLQPADLPAAGAILGRALADSPVFADVYPTNQGKRTAGLGQIFAALLKAQASHGRILGGYVGGELRGVCTLAEPGGCQLGTLDKLAVGRAAASAVSLGTSVALQKMLSDRGLRDPQVRHFHLGWIGVEPGKQRQGIGTALMHEFCRRVDVGHEIAAAETDRTAAVAFLGRFGFKEMTSAVVGGVRHAFLIRSRM